MGRGRRCIINRDDEKAHEREREGHYNSVCKIVYGCGLKCILSGHIHKFLCVPSVRWGLNRPAMDLTGKLLS